MDSQLVKAGGQPPQSFWTKILFSIESASRTFTRFADELINSGNTSSEELSSNLVETELDYTIRENALKILGLSEEIFHEHFDLEQHYNDLSQSFQSRFDDPRSTNPLRDRLTRELTHISIAYRTLQLNQRANSSEKN